MTKNTHLIIASFVLGWAIWCLLDHYVAKKPKVDIAYNMWGGVWTSAFFVLHITLFGK